jgi:hypothetical protein
MSIIYHPEKIQLFDLVPPGFIFRDSSLVTLQDCRGVEFLNH